MRERDAVDVVISLFASAGGSYTPESLDTEEIVHAVEIDGGSFAYLAREKSLSRVPPIAIVRSRVYKSATSQIGNLVPS